MSNDEFETREKTDAIPHKSYMKLNKQQNLEILNFTNHAGRVQNISVLQKLSKWVLSRKHSPMDINGIGKFKNLKELYINARIFSVLSPLRRMQWHKHFQINNDLKGFVAFCEKHNLLSDWVIRSTLVSEQY